MLRVSHLEHFHGRGEKGYPDVTRAAEQKPTVLLSAPIISTLLNWHLAEVRGKDSDQRCVYIKVLPCHTDNHLFSTLHIRQELLISKQKTLLDEIARKNFFRFISLDAFCAFCALRSTLTSSDISVGSRLFKATVDRCQNVTGARRASIL